MGWDGPPRWANERTHAAMAVWWESSRQLRNPPFSLCTLFIYMNSTPITSDVAHLSFSKDSSRLHPAVSRW
jgi:hypothetical protein